MIDRILFHIYSNDLFNDNQYGFTPQTGTTVMQKWKLKYL